VAQETEKLPKVKVGGTKKNPRLKPGLHARGVDQADLLSGSFNFFTSNFDIWQFCSLFNYKVA